RKRPIVLLLSDRKLYSTSGYTAAYAGPTVRLQQWSSARPATSPLSSAHAPSAAMKRTGKHFGFVPLADKCTAIYKVNGNLPDQLVGGRPILEGHRPSMNFRALWLGPQQVRTNLVTMIIFNHAPQAGDAK